MISLDRLASALGITQADEVDVVELERWRDAALSYIESETRRYFGPVTSSTMYLRGLGTRSLYLPSLGTVTAVSEVTHAGATPEVIDTAASDGWEVRTHGNEAELVRKGGNGLGVWTRGYDYAVTFSRGYVENQGPKDVEDLLIELVRIQYNTGGESGALKSETIGGYSYTLADDADVSALSDRSRETLENWRRMVFA